MKRVIVTGAGGFIGRALVRLLEEKGIEVLRLTHDNILNDRKALNGGGIDACYHLAWQGVDSAKKNAVDIQLENVRYAMKVLETAHEAGCKKFIGIGSAAEYSLAETVMDFSKKQTPIDLYGACKSAAYYILQTMALQFNMPFMWVIMPNIYGPENKNQDILMYTIKNILEEKELSYGSLDNQWEFLHVEDAARGLYLLGDKGVPGKVYGIGTGEFHPLRYYVETTIRCMDLNKTYLEGNKKSLKKGCCVDNTDMVQDTGFRTEYSFEEGIRSVIEWYRQESKK